jgi:hypothetical protein
VICVSQRVRAIIRTHVSLDQMLEMNGRMNVRFYRQCIVIIISEVTKSAARNFKLAVVVCVPEFRLC